MTRRADDAISKNSTSSSTAPPPFPNCPWATSSSRKSPAKSTRRGTRLLVLDEPTAVLTESEADILLDSMRRLAAQGISIIFISHRLQEVMSVCDDIVILRDGEVVLQTTPAETSVRQIASAMVGRQEDRPRRRRRGSAGALEQGRHGHRTPLGGHARRNRTRREPHRVRGRNSRASAAWPVRASSASPTASWACILRGARSPFTAKTWSSTAPVSPTFHGHFRRVRRSARRRPSA